MTPPGLAFASVSERARERAPAPPRTRASRSTGSARCQAQAKGQTPFTPAISLVQALDVALQTIEAEGLEARFERTVRLGRGVRAGVRRTRARAVLARPRRLLARHGRAVAGGRRRRGDAPRAARPARHHGGRRPGRARPAASCASARSARSRRATSCAAWRRSRWSCSQAGHVLELGAGRRGVLARLRGMRVLVTEPIAAAGIDRLREAAEVDVVTDLDRERAAGADRRLRRARRALGDAVDAELIARRRAAARDRPRRHRRRQRRRRGRDGARHPGLQRAACRTRCRPPSTRSR